MTRRKIKSRSKTKKFLFMHRHTYKLVTINATHKKRAIEIFNIARTNAYEYDYITLKEYEQFKQLK